MIFCGKNNVSFFQNCFFFFSYLTSLYFGYCKLTFHYFSFFKGQIFELTTTILINVDRISIGYIYIELYMYIITIFN